MSGSTNAGYSKCQSGRQSKVQEQGRRIRWQRDPADPEKIIIFDAVTGEVIAVVRSLFDTWPQ